MEYLLTHEQRLIQELRFYTAPIRPDGTAGCHVMLAILAATLLPALSKAQPLGLT